MPCPTFQIPFIEESVYIALPIITIMTGLSVFESPHIINNHII